MDVVTYSYLMSTPAGSCIGWERSLQTWKTVQKAHGKGCLLFEMRYWEPWIILDSTLYFWTLGWVLKWPWHLKKRWVVMPSSESWSVFSPVWILYQRFVLSTDSPLSVITSPTAGDCNSPVARVKLWRAVTQQVAHWHGIPPISTKL